MKSYLIRKTDSKPSLMGNWEGDIWQTATTASITHYHPQSSNHRPETTVKVLYDEKKIYVCFRVVDRYVRSVHTIYQQHVASDSCVEFFVKPREETGYLNFEINCGGTMLLYYIEDSTRIGTGFANYEPVSEDMAKRMEIYHTMPVVVEPEISKRVVWIVEYSVPLELIESFVGPLRPLHGQRWRGNFFKCGDETSHPHWGSWCPIGKELNFHRPEYFGILKFADSQ